MPVEVIVFIWVILMVIFGSPIIITRMILQSRRQRTQIADEELRELHRRIDELHAKMDEGFADLTLMLDELPISKLPPSRDANE